MEQICAEVGVIPPNIFEAMIGTESDFNPSSRSRSGALGLGQIIYRWHSALVDDECRKLGLTPHEGALYNAELNLRCSARYLKSTYTQCGSWVGAVRKYHSGSCDPPDSFKDGHGTTSDAHINRFTQYLRAVEAHRANTPQGDTLVAGSTVTWPGLPGGPITFSFAFSMRYLVPASRTLNRPGIKARKPRLPVQHENGNPNAYAAQDSAYLHGGAGGRQASWHATVDHMEGFANLPADEVGWHAGDGAGNGNYAGFAIELSQRSLSAGSAAWREARRHAAEVMGRVMARLDGSVTWGQHAWYMAKNCPQNLRGNATWWAEYATDCAFYYNDERKRMTGTAAPPSTAFRKGDHFEVIIEVINARQGWGTSARLIGEYRAKARGVIKDGPQYANGYTWWDTEVAGFGSAWIAEGLPGEPWIKKVAPPAPPPPPKVYAPRSPVPELLETTMKIEDMYNTSAGVTTVNEVDFIFVADVVEFKRPSPALQYGMDNAKEVKAPYQEGDRTVAAWLTKGKNGLYYYLLAGGDDEWVRVKYIDTVRVSDAPLLGDEMA